jgi:UDP-3-O-[3-hydroxymyristoyl] N-acetylglucosamine deacetylase
MNQCTLKSDVTFSGIGVHSGIEANVTIRPAAPNTGFTFIRTDMDASNQVILGSYDSVSETMLCTVISNEYGVKVSTIEHLMSAFYGVGIDNAIIEIDSEEMPIMDGSSVKFMELLVEAGIEEQRVPRKYIKIDKELVVQNGDQYIKFLPSDDIEFSCEIDFAHPAIGAQSYTFSEKSDNYQETVSKARTFGFARDIEKLRAMGLARGGSLENAVGIDDNGVMNKEGLRYENEFARHKVLDLMGDLFLAGCRIIGKIESRKPSHNINNIAVHELLKTFGACSYDMAKAA